MKLVRYGAVAAVSTAFGSLWVAQFVILDRALFGRLPAPEQKEIPCPSLPS
jgi:hypothetical protein